MGGVPQGVKLPEFKGRKSDGLPQTNRKRIFFIQLPFGELDSSALN